MSLLEILVAGTIYLVVVLLLISWFTFLIGSMIHFWYELDSILSYITFYSFMFAVLIGSAVYIIYTIYNIGPIIFHPSLWISLII